jgi:hypothetical protein
MRRTPQPVLFLLISLGFLVNSGTVSRAEGGAGLLDRLAHAVDGAESSHGADPHMWRADLNGPQGPMQVTAAAAADVGGGDRFDLEQNRNLGRAYLDRMYRRFGTWPDAVAAYNWGPSRTETWIGAGRPFSNLPATVATYRTRVLLASGFGVSDGQGRQSAAGLGRVKLGIVHPQPRRPSAVRAGGNRPDEVELLYVAIMRATEPLSR